MTKNLDLPPMFQKIAQEKLPDTAPTLSPQDSAQLDAANAAIAALAKEYPAWATRDINKMKSLFNDAKSIPHGDRADLVRKELFKICHNAKGQGATFNYPLISEIGNHLCRLIESSPEFDETTMIRIKQHIDAMETILKEQLTGDGGRKGQLLKKAIFQ